MRFEVQKHLATAVFHPFPIMFEPVRPAEVAFDDGGTLRSLAYDDVYASSHGALAQARHVFLGGNDLPARWRNAGHFTIVETGFGAGTNFLATWQAFREGAPASARLHFVSVEKHPFARADLAAIHARDPALAGLSEPLLDRYPPLLPGFHRLHLDRGRVTLTLLFGDGEAMLGELDARADAFYLDGFAPAKNPDFWSAGIFAQVARLSSPGATFATYTVAAAVCDGLAKAGFTLERRPGFASKREMLCGRFGAEAAASRARARNAVVIGAGLAGTSCAHRLAQRGWDVQLLDARDAIAQEASGNPAGLVRPVFSPDWNTHSRFTSAGFLYAERHERDLRAAGGGSVRGEGGVLQFARDATRFEKQQRLVEAFALPPEVVRIVSDAQARDLAGVRVAGPASWFPAAFWARPASMCAANVAGAAGAIRVRLATKARALQRKGGEWEVVDPAGHVIARGAVVVLANALAAGTFAQAAWLPLRTVRGQVSLMRERQDRRLRIPVCGDGYVTPAVDGLHCFGASFNEDMAEPALRFEDHAANLKRLHGMLPGFADGCDPASLGGRVAWRTMSRDRLPVVGEIEDGLYACLALGSRGMTWAALAAEAVASRVAGDPLPLEASLASALAPARFSRVMSDEQ